MFQEIFNLLCPCWNAHVLGRTTHIHVCSLCICVAVFPLSEEDKVHCLQSAILLHR